MLMNGITKQLWDDMMYTEHEPSDAEIICLMLLVAIVEFVFGFMFGVSY